MWVCWLGLHYRSNCTLLLMYGLETRIYNIRFCLCCQNWFCTSKCYIVICIYKNTAVIWNTLHYQTKCLPGEGMYACVYTYMYTFTCICVYVCVYISIYTTEVHVLKHFGSKTLLTLYKAIICFSLLMNSVARHSSCMWPENAPHNVWK